MLEGSQIDIKQRGTFGRIDELKLTHALELQIGLSQVLCVWLTIRRLSVSQRNATVHLLKGNFGDIFMKVHFKGVLKRFEQMRKGKLCFGRG